ncbi:MAG: hypothetical protein ACHP9S_09325 [Terriglobales bacterium]
MKTSTEDFLVKFSKLKGPNKVLQAAALMLADAAGRVDHKLTKRHVQLAHCLLLSLNKALPDTDRQLIGDFVAEVTDLWDYGQELDKTLKELCEMRLPQHSERMREALVGIEVTQFDYALDCIKGLQKSLPKLKQALDRQAKKSAGRRKQRKQAATRG